MTSREGEQPVHGTTKLLRTIRLDASDTFVYANAARPSEWAVPGGFMFWDRDPASLTGRDRQAFRAGFLGLSSFGWSTLAVVVSATPSERRDAIECLAQHLSTAHGAPDPAQARAAAAEEIAFAEQLAEHPEQTLIALHRTVRDDGLVSEQFRTFHAADANAGLQMPCSAGAFAIVEDDSYPRDGEPHDAADAIDLAALATAAGAAKP